MSAANPCLTPPPGTGPVPLPLLQTLPGLPLPWDGEWELLAIWLSLDHSVVSLSRACAVAALPVHRRIVSKARDLTRDYTCDCFFYPYVDWVYTIERVAFS